MMKNNKRKAPERRILVTLAFYLSVILAALLLGVTGQIAPWVAQVMVSLPLFRLVFLFGWGAAKNGWRWRV